jgi:hypothetical protein
VNRDHAILALAVAIVPTTAPTAIYGNLGFDVQVVRAAG